MGLTAATVNVIGEYCKLPPNLDKPTEELAFYGDLLTTRYWSPIRFFTFITLNAPICSAESVTRHVSLKRAAAGPHHITIVLVSTQPKTGSYKYADNDVVRSPGCSTARSYYKTCFYKWVEAHNGVPNSPEGLEHTWNCFCQNQGPETGIGGGLLGPWEQNASACDECINFHLHANFDSFPIIQKYCDIQTGRFDEAAYEMISQAAYETYMQSGGANLLNYTLGFPGQPAFEDSRCSPSSFSLSAFRLFYKD